MGVCPRSTDAGMVRDEYLLILIDPPLGEPGPIGAGFFF